MTGRSLLWHRWATAFAAMALLVRMMVPAGFMPMTNAAGLPTLVICPGQQPLPELPMAGMTHGDHGVAMQHGSGKSDPADHGGDHACPFGALAASADLAGVAFGVPLLPIATTILLAAPLFVRPGIGLAAPPPPKTGPPSLD